MNKILIIKDKKQLAKFRDPLVQKYQDKLFNKIDYDALAQSEISQKGRAPMKKRTAYGLEEDRPTHVGCRFPDLFLSGKCPERNITERIDNSLSIGI